MQIVLNKIVFIEASKQNIILIIIQVVVISKKIMKYITNKYVWRARAFEKKD